MQTRRWGGCCGYTYMQCVLGCLCIHRAGAASYNFSPAKFNIGTSLVAQTVKHLPTMRETWVQPLGREDLLEKEMATHSSILVWKIPWTEEPGRLQSVELQNSGHNLASEQQQKI